MCVCVLIFFQLPKIAYCQFVRDDNRMMLSRVTPQPVAHKCESFRLGICRAIWRRRGEWEPRSCVGYSLLLRVWSASGRRLNARMRTRFLPVEFRLGRWDGPRLGHSNFRASIRGWGPARSKKKKQQHHGGLGLVWCGTLVSRFHVF